MNRLLPASLASRRWANVQKMGALGASSSISQKDFAPHACSRASTALYGLPCFMDALVLLLCCLPDFARSIVSGKLRKASEKPWTESTWLMDGGAAIREPRGLHGNACRQFLPRLAEWTSKPISWASPEPGVTGTKPRSPFSTAKYLMCNISYVLAIKSVPFCAGGQK